MHDLKISHNIHKDEKRGTYYFRLKYYDVTGKRKEISRSGFKMRKDAVQECNRFIDELEGIGKINKLPFDELAKEYLEWYSARRKASSIKALKTHLNNHLLPFFNKADVFEIDTKLIMKFQNKKLKEGYSGEFLKKMHVFLVQILNHAITYHGLEKNVASLVGNFEIESHKRLEYWTLDQFNTFIDAVPSLQHRMFFSLLYWTGCRKGECRALTWNDINWNEGYIHIDKTDYHGTITTTKTKASTRDVYLPDHIMQELKQYQEWYKQHNVYKDFYVLFGTFTKPFSESTIDRWYKTVLDSLGDDIPRIVLHEFRHSHASLLINNGASPMIVASRLGHSSTVEVTTRYGHLYPSTQKEIIHLMDKNRINKFDIEHFSEWNFIISDVQNYAVVVAGDDLTIKEDNKPVAKYHFTLENGTPNIKYATVFKEGLKTKFDNSKKTIDLEG